MYSGKMFNLPFSWFLVVWEPCNYTDLPTAKATGMAQRTKERRRMDMKKD